MIYIKRNNKRYRVKVVFEDENVLVYRQLTRPWKGQAYSEHRMVAPHNFYRDFDPEE